MKIENPVTSQTIFLNTPWLKWKQGISRIFVPPGFGFAKMNMNF